jgi:hypothetical protein
MEQPAPPDQGPDDVLSMGEDGGSSRWVRVGAVLVVLLLGLGVYRLVSEPSTPGAPEPAAAAQGQSSPGFAAGGSYDGRGSSGAQVTQVRLGHNLVTLHGAGVQQAHRETSAAALGRFRQGWIVQLTSRACEDRTDSQVAYGMARASGRFTSWEESATARRPQWRSPDGRLVLVVRGQHVRVRQVQASTPLAEFKAGL